MPVDAGAGAAIDVEVVLAAHAEVAGVIASAVATSDVVDVAVVGD
jgi:N-acetylglutamate synthase/N-acetylornithine aminotransferase